MLEDWCQKKGCPRKPTHYVVLAVPAVGAAPTTPKCRMTIGLQLCRDHAESADVYDMLTVAGEKQVIEALRSYGCADPDFERATVEKRRIGDSNWNYYQQAVADNEARRKRMN
jgi:hypothetical protein